MARIEIKIPDEKIFSTKLSVRVYDVNYGKHLGNDSVLSIAHEARVRLFSSHDYSEIDVEGLGIIQTDCAIVYKSEAFLGEILIVDIFVTDINKYGFDFIYKITEESSKREIARVKTGIVFFDYSAKKVKNIPEQFAKKIYINNT